MNDLFLGIFIFGGLFLLIKLIDNFVKNLEETQKNKERDKIFGKQNQKVEIYDPKEDE